MHTFTFYNELNALWLQGIGYEITNIMREICMCVCVFVCNRSSEGQNSAKMKTDIFNIPS